MAEQLIECVPNFSEGRDESVIEKIVSEIRSTRGVKLLNVDPGKATNRTVVTFVGTPDEVVEAAFKAIKKASELINMAEHKGEHPRMGATDVCPFIPLANISIEETVEYAKKLAKRVGEELSIPVYLYEYAASREERRNLATIREGEYEGFAKKIQHPDWKPDFGPATFNLRSGATVIGARDFLIAYNVNLNTTSTRIANAIAFDVREQGRVKRKGHPVLGEIEMDELGNPVRIPGSLKSVKAIGWYIEEYGIAQISMNLTNMHVTPVHKAFDEVLTKAQSRGVRVTGSEIVGMVPKSVLIDAGLYFLEKQGRSLGVSEEELIQIAILSLGLNDITDFKPKERIIEYMLEEGSRNPLNQLTIRQFANLTAAETPAPGGGSISAYVGALGASLGTMVANLSANKRGWEDKVEFFSDHAFKGQQIKDELLLLVDEDTRAFNQVMAAFAMDKNTDEEKANRKKAIEEANIYAARVPLKVMETAFRAFELIAPMVEQGNPNSITDSGVGGLCIRTAIQGAYLNIKTNVSGINNAEAKKELLDKAESIMQHAYEKEKQIIEVVTSKLGV
jgi:glutamate formiminotransferase/formiminotetrahydrofolate cyclodeaminase